MQPDFCVSVSNPFMINVELYKYWLSGIPEANLPYILYTNFIRVKQNNPEPSKTIPNIHTFKMYVSIWYQNFKNLEKYLKNPSLMWIQPIIDFDPTKMEILLNHYYKFDYNIFAELVCSEDGIFTRKELGEIAQKVAIEQTVVFRQFDNLSNIFKSCENINNIKNIYEHIRSKYMICTDLVRFYSACVFLLKNEFDLKNKLLKSIPFDVFIKGTYFIIFHWFLTDDMPSLTIPSLSDTSNAIGDVDKEFFTQLKYMVAKFSDKQFYEYFKIICQENIKTAGLKNLDSSDSIKFAFKTLCSNIIYMANRLNCTKDLNDFFFVIVDKLIIPSKSKDLSEEVFQTLLKIMLDSSNELIDIEQEIVNIFQKFMNVLIGCSTLMYPYKYEQTH